MTQTLRHFVGFQSLADQRLSNAELTFGRADFLHRWLDRRAQREISDGDLVLLAKGAADQPPNPFNANDEAYE